MTNDGVGMLVQHNNKFLLLHRTNEDIWECPKGHLEKEETDHNTIKRELMEETSIQNFQVKKIIGQLKFTFTDKKKGLKKIRKINYYHVTVRSTDITLSSEHDNYILLRRDSFLEKLQFKDIKNMLQNYLDT